MQPFIIRATSQVNTVIALILIAVVFIPLALLRNALLPISWNIGEFWVILIILPPLALFYGIYRTFATSKTLWTISDSSLIVHWLTRSFIVKESDIDISWSEVESIKKRVDPIYTTLTLKLTNSKDVKFHFLNLSFGKDCDDLLIELNRHYTKKSGS